MKLLKRIGIAQLGRRDMRLNGVAGVEADYVICLMGQRRVYLHDL